MATLYNYVNNFIQAPPQSQKQIISQFIGDCPVPSYQSFQHDGGDRGIPSLIHHYKNFDPINDPIDDGNMEVCNWIQPTLLHFKHLSMYLSDPLFNSSLLQTCEYDAVCHAIISFILTWNPSAWNEYAHHFPAHSELIYILKTETQKVRILCYKNIPFIRTTFKVLKHYFGEMENSARLKPIFNARQYLKPVFIDHIREFYARLLTNTMTEKFKQSLEMSMSSPFLDIMENVQGLETPIKFLTGVACVGKSTFLEGLKQHGFIIRSRGDIGSFAGKSHSATQIASLHGSMEYALRLTDCIGDRGPIDNPLWTAIMPLCDVQYQANAVMLMLNKIMTMLNENVIRYYMQQKGVIFIETSIAHNRLRMLKRNEGGDCHRARIKQYVPIQSLAYYTVGRLFGWKIICTPYINGEFTPQKYQKYIPEILEYFGPAIPQLIDPTSSRPDDSFDLSNTYPHDVGIYK